MYPNPHLIWVAGLVCQSAPALAILLPGSDCGMPNAPEDAFIAEAFQPDSFIHKLDRHPIWSPPHP